MEETNPPRAKAATREEIIASLTEIAKGTQHSYFPGQYLLALDMDKQEMICGDRVKVYDQVEAQIQVVTKTGDLIINIDGNLYYCPAGNVRSKMINPP
jgi:hypothetical protein